MMPAPEIVAPKQIDLQVPAQSDFDLAFTLTDEDGDIVDISTDTVMLTVYRALRDSSALIFMSNGPGEHSAPTLGETTYSLVPSDTDWMVRSEELVYYELWREYDGGKMTPWFKGSILFTAVRGI